VAWPGGLICLNFSLLPCEGRVYYWGMPIDFNDYYVITSRTGEQSERWSWEIQRKSTPLGIKMTAGGFQSDSAAQFAGKRELAEFLLDLVKEDKRSSK
jgi:Protein of unknown function (DUF3622)